MARQAEFPTQQEGQAPPAPVQWWAGARQTRSRNKCRNAVCLRQSALQAAGTGQSSTG